ncbi:MAG: GNAT family N-acetyltransferase [Candidatus Gracilibacteria bacterium]
MKNIVSKIFIIKNEEGAFLGYVALALKNITRNALNPPKSDGIFDRPALVIGQLLIGENFRRQGCGKAVLKWVIAIVRVVGNFVPLRLLVVEALHDDAKKYYEDRGFKPLPGDPYTLVLDLLKILEGKGGLFGIVFVFSSLRILCLYLCLCLRMI